MLTSQQQHTHGPSNGVCPAYRPHVKATAGEMPQMQLAHPSPKRKRDQPQQMPLLNTALAIRPAQTPPHRDTSASSGADSPRNAVADQLRGMTLISTAAIPMSPLTPTDDAKRKKPKLGAVDLDEAHTPGTHTAQMNAKPRKETLPLLHNPPPLYPHLAARHRCRLPSAARTASPRRQHTNP
ncbi:hypothetical protein OPT61_g10685 [Boeremia exigua]|uniref:Uncharacterized protein n=1 Tax=Boeremia exigua TaxID=749465 RepID=A0ACC2HNH4_9PLEO|nr:hypothetical protein OPT61_g10685 [Boeremia exigua]